MIPNLGRCPASRWLCALTAAWSFAGFCALAAGQQPVIMVEGQPMSPDQAKAMMEAQRRGGAQPPGQPGQPPNQDPNQKKDEKGKKEGEGGDAKKEEAGGDTVKRPEKPPRVPDPRELEVALDERGRVPPFNFIGQPWPDVMQWLANLSKSSLDWQELPGGYLNLTTQRPYKVDEVRDLINRHLHARGYTAVQAGEVLSVFKLDKLDPSVVRRVSEDELYDLTPYDFVKVSFELPTGIEVEKAKEDVKQVLSPNAKVFPLVTTKRLLVIDAVANLRLVSALMNEERAVQDGRIIPRNFVLKYARPEQVIETLYVILGSDPKNKPAQTDPRVQQQMMQQMQQMQQQGKDVSKLLQGDQPQVYLAYNRQLNSVMANAPPREMKIIEQTIALLDVPFGGSVGLPATGGDNAPDGSARDMRKYPLTTLDPENFVVTLEQIGGLSPFAEFKIDKKSKTLFALASPADHEKIAGLIEDFDGSGREFEVIWLRRLPADAVAATIYNLMAGQTEEKEDNNRRGYYPWDYYGRNNEEEDEKVKGFGVDADIENNRLLLWANEAEMQRVRGLLVKLGEIPSGQQDPRPVRFVQPNADKSTAELLEQLRDAWSASGGNKLIIKVPSEEPAAKAKQKEEAPAPKKAEESTGQPATDRSAAALRGKFPVVAQYVQLGQPVVEAEEAEEKTSPEPTPAPIPAAERAVERDIEPDVAERETKTTVDPAAEAAQALPPVTVTVTEDGRLMLSSADPAALDEMEKLIEQLSPPEKRFRVFRLQYISALNMKWNLEDFFADELKGEDSGYMRDWYGFMVPKGSQEGGKGGLSKRRKLMISWDTPSNTILIANASPGQMHEIEQLIAEYDRPTQDDSGRTRRNAAIKIQYSRASVIADAIKEVYRDLLSSRDKEFDRGGDERQRGQSRETVTVFRYGSGDGDGGGSKRPTPVKVGFEGALSIGVDDISNMIIVSVQEELYDGVVNMIKTLDEEAAPKAVVHVHRVSGNVTAEALREAIDDAMSKPWPGGRPEQEAGRGGGRGRGDRGRGDRGGDGRRGRDRRDNN